VNVTLLLLIPVKSKNVITQLYGTVKNCLVFHLRHAEISLPPPTTL